MRRHSWVVFAVIGGTACGGSCCQNGGGCDIAPVSCEWGDSGPCGFLGCCFWGCSDGAPFPEDSGADAAIDATLEDSGAIDAFTEAAPGPPPPANLVLAHAAPGIPPFRICFAAGSGSTATITPISALPDTYPSGVPYGFYGQNGDGGGPYPNVAAGTPGLYPGTIGAFPSLGLSYQGLTITPYLILASSIQNDINTDGGAGINAADGSVEEDCVGLLGTHGLGPNETAAGSQKGRLVPGMDFFKLPTIPSGTLKDSHTYLLSLNGCLQGGAYDPSTQQAGLTCGAWDAGPWISIDPIDTTTAVPDGGMGFQFANRSSALQNTGLCIGASGVVPQAPNAACPGGVAIGVPNGGYAESPAGNGVNADILIQTEEDAGPDAAPTLLVTSVPLSPAAPSLYGNALTPVMIVPIPAAAAQLFGIITATRDGGPPDITGPGANGYSAFTEWPITDTIPVPGAAVLQSSGWTASTQTSSSPDGKFHDGASYMLVLMGDPAWDALNPAGTLLPDAGLNPAYDGRGLHLVAFPSVFTPLGAPGL